MNITHKYDEAELQGMLDRRLYLYERQIEGPGVRGAIIKLSCDWPSQLIDQVMSHAQQGFKQHETMTPEIVNPSIYIAYLTKPEKLEKADIADIKAEVKAEYRAELQERYDAHVEAVTAETVQRRTREREGRS